MQPDIDMFRMFLFRVRDQITPAHLLILIQGDQFPVIPEDQELTSPDGLINPLCSAAVSGFDAAEAAMRSRYNIGCLAHPSGLMFLDFTHVDGVLPVPDKIILYFLQVTLIMKTWSGGYRACFVHDGVSSDNKLLYNGKIVGDVRRSGYVVCPGSCVQADFARYGTSRDNPDEGYQYNTLLNAISPIRFDASRLPAGLSLDISRVMERQVTPVEPPVKPESEDFYTVDGVSLEYLKRKLFWVERALADIASDQSPHETPAAKDLARLGFDPGTIARILVEYRPRTGVDKGPEYLAKIASEAYIAVKSEGRIYGGQIVDGWLREEMNWRLAGKKITRDSQGS